LIRSSTITVATKRGRGVINCIRFDTAHFKRKERKKERVTMEDNDPIRPGSAIACALGGITVLAGIAFGYCMSRQRNPATAYEPDVEATPVATKTDNEFHVDSAVASLPPTPKKHFLENDEAWERARYLFPGLVKESHTRYGRRFETIISELLREKVTELRKQGDTKFELLMKRENAVDLCIALGLNETVVRKRYEAISNVEREFKFVSKTPTLVSIQHLIYRIGVNDPFGEEADMDGLIKKDYKGTEWLSYLGVQVKKGKVVEALKSVTDQLDHFKYADSYMHGTSATALLGIEENDGRLAASQSNMRQGGARHDFGDGFYCFKGKLN
jgi:hypothetical protein